MHAIKVKHFLLVNTLLFAFACHEPPTVGRAANPDLANKNMRVMGGGSNQNVLKSITILKDFLNGTLKSEDVDARIDKDFDYIEVKNRDLELRTLLGYLKNYKSSVQKAPLPAIQKKMIEAQFYYEEHRYLNAAQLFTEVLDQQVDYPEARNLLSRCFFFLGNTDKAIQELEIRMKQIEAKSKDPSKLNASDSNEYIDALYVIGGIVSEDPRPTKPKIERGLQAWKAYAQLAPTSPQIKQIKEGIQDFEDRLSGKKPISGRKTPTGAKSGAAGAIAKKGHRVEELKADATDLEKAIAKALDAFDERDTMTAIAALEQAQKIDAKAPAVMTGLARVQVLLGNYPKGLELYALALKAHPNYMPAWHYQGMAFMMSQKPAEAAKSWRYIEKSDPSYFAKANLARRVMIAERMSKR